MYFIFLLGSNMMYIKAKCVPETRQSSESYQLWILVEKSGQIYSAECNCVAGDGTCKHVAAALFGLLAFCVEMEDRATVAVTDKEAYWTLPKRVCRPLVVDDIDIRSNMTAARKERPTPSDGYLPIHDVNEHEIEKSLVKLVKKCSIPSVALYTLSDSDCSDSDCDLEEYPKNIPELVQEHGHLQDVAKHITLSEVNRIPHLTLGQSDNPMWKYQRLGRLTASNFYRAIHYQGQNENNSIVKSVLGLYAEFSTNAVNYGKEMELVAREKYVSIMSPKLVSFSAEETGLHVYADFPYLAASPDGLVNCKCCPPGLVEIKCPYSLGKILAKASWQNCHLLQR
ncbi:uncharacterized protein LOC134278956 [Saccostrea cucullata]|uniref:uncharacterized protein LOC134278956 n=1 Tax=Saccostrea cuccullata TaxID=36930 RepID=UPI002ED6443C